MSKVSIKSPEQSGRHAEFSALETCDISPPQTRAHTRLFPLEPIGIGTPLVEGLASYLAALAFEHSITTRNLIRHELFAPSQRPGQGSNGELRR